MKISAHKPHPGQAEKFWTLDQNGGDMELRQLEATCRSAHDDVFVYVEDELWEKSVGPQDIARLERDLHQSSPPDSVSPGTGILGIHRPLFEKDRAPVTVLLSKSHAPFEGYFNPADLLSEEEAQAMGGHSNERQIVHLNMAQAHGRLSQVFSHEYQHLLHHQYDQDEETWLQELLAQSAMNLSGYRDREMEASSRLHFAAPLVTRDQETANYPGLTSFAAHLQEHFGAGFLSQLSKHPENGIESINQTLKQSGRADTFETTYRDYLREQAESLLAASPADGSAPNQHLEHYRLKSTEDLLLSNLRPGEARFIKLDNAEPTTLALDGSPSGSFVEVLTYNNGRLRSEPYQNQPLQGGPGRYLMIGNALQETELSLRFQSQATDRDLSEILQQPETLSFPFGKVDLAVPLHVENAPPPAELEEQFRSLEKTIAAAPNRNVPQDLPSAPQAALTALKILYSQHWQSEEEQRHFLNHLAFSGNPLSALGVTEVLRAVQPQDRARVVNALEQKIQGDFQRRIPRVTPNFQEIQQTGTALTTMLFGK